jgi:hypothetical protein
MCFLPLDAVEAVQPFAYWGYLDASLDLPGLVPGIHVAPRDKPGGDDPSYFCGYFI